MLSWKRTLRTTSSERFLALREGKDVAAVDLHYLASGTVAGTVILLKDAGWKESDVPALLGSLDEDFLPDVDLDHMGGSVLINGSMSSCHSIDYNVRSSLRKFNIKSLCLIR